jgi:hypothetical protein
MIQPNPLELPDTLALAGQRGGGEWELAFSCAFACVRVCVCVCVCVWVCMHLPYVGRVGQVGIAGAALTSTSTAGLRASCNSAHMPRGEVYCGGSAPPIIVANPTQRTRAALRRVGHAVQEAAGWEGRFLPVFGDTPTAGGPSHRTGARAWARAKARAALQTRSHTQDRPCTSTLGTLQQWEGGRHTCHAMCTEQQVQYIYAHGHHSPRNLLHIADKTHCSEGAVACGRVTASIIAHARSSTAEF